MGLQEGYRYQPSEYGASGDGDGIGESCIGSTSLALSLECIICFFLILLLHVSLGFRDAVEC